MRWIIEGEWTGYRSSQQHIVHRTVTSRKDIADWVAATHAIRFTDGTSLLLTVRPTKRRERVKQIIHGYDELLNDCRHYRVTSVDALGPAREAAKARAAVPRVEA